MIPAVQKAKLQEASQLAFNAISPLVERLRRHFGLVPVMGAELEWYVRPAIDHEGIAAVHQAVVDEANERGYGVSPVVAEVGLGQYEMAFDSREDPAQLAEAVCWVREHLHDGLHKAGFYGFFGSKPFSDEYGNALQLHIHLMNQSRERVFSKMGGELSYPLEASIAGILAITHEVMVVAASRPESFARFTAGFDAPTTICWGGNNRSVLLRLPLRFGPLCHIEYRLGGAEADAASLIASVLAGVLHGMERKISSPEPVYGVASDAQYNLPPLPKNFELAREMFRSAAILPAYLGDEWFAAYNAYLDVFDEDIFPKEITRNRKKR